MILEALTASSTGISSELAVLAERVRPSVVEIHSDGGSGAGVIWSPDGLIVTNHHVVPGDRTRVALADGRTFDATVERRDPAHDLAALRVSAHDLPAATIGDSTGLRVGQIVVAIGNPFGRARAMTVGIISGPGEGSQGRLQWRDAIQSGIELRPGNSGGPLLDVAGRVIGINSMVIGPRLALSIPTHTVLTFLTGQTSTAYLGVTVQSIPLPAALAGTGIDQPAGLIVTNIAEGSPADTSGLLPGDLLVTLEPQAEAAGDLPRQRVPLIEPGDLAWAMARARSGAPLTLTLVRAGQVHQQTVTPGSRP